MEKKRKLRPLIRHDEKLLGLILGFGRESSKAFKIFINGQELDAPIETVGYKPKGYSITPVSFKGNPHSQEVKELIAIYTKEIQKIEVIYNKDNFLITTLEAFCAN